MCNTWVCISVVVVTVRRRPTWCAASTSRSTSRVRSTRRAYVCNTWVCISVVVVTVRRRPTWCAASTSRSTSRVRSTRRAYVCNTWVCISVVVVTVRRRPTWCAASTSRSTSRVRSTRRVCVKVDVYKRGGGEAANLVRSFDVSGGGRWGLGEGCVGGCGGGGGGGGGVEASQGVVQRRARHDRSARRARLKPGLGYLGLRHTSIAAECNAPKSLVAAHVYSCWLVLSLRSFVVATPQAPS